jgi:SHOCT-like protein/putative adhesin
MSKSIFVGNFPKIKLDKIDGDLSVVAWGDADLVIKADERAVRFEQTGETVSVSCSTDLALRIPKGAVLMINSAAGDTSIRGLQGAIEIKEIHGDLSVREVGALAIDTIHGDFSLRGSNGDLYIKNAHGDVSIRDVDGNVTLDSVADDLALRGARGNIKVNVGDDVVVYLEPKPDGAYSVKAGDDILLVLPKNTNATITMQGDDIDVDWPAIEKDEDATERVVVLGDGSAKISLNAAGDVRVTNRADAGESAEEFGNFAGLNFDWSGFGERISRQVEQAISPVTKRAEEAARRAERHAARHVRRAGPSKSGPGMGRWNWEFKGTPRPPNPPEPPSEPVAEEERMAILKMLAEKKITSQQAEELLNALEGGK